MRGLVISGGGSKGAFAVGVLKYLIKEKGLDYDFISGTSTGALIAPLAATKEIDKLEEIYTTRTTKDILIKREPFAIENLPKINKFDSFFDVTPLRNLTKQELFPRYDAIMQSGKTLFFTAICLQTGRVTYFASRNAESTSEFDLVVLNDKEEMLNAIMASANQPVLMPPVEFKPGTYPIRQYVDGGVREYVPIRGVIANNVEEIDVILHSPPFYPIKAERFSNIFGILFQTIDLFSEDVGDSDLRNAMLLAEKKNIKINVYRPKNELPIKDGLTFTPQQMKDSLAMGYDVAVSDYLSHT
ncbi:MAG: patatin-like phospholipase family protein [Chlorobi bacterium]|nr:patatin-like phospholipase family protein [Chlorobiota bacterium]MCI0715527.1 patatin-like phospholipase family protein [Chlorobiota bacterium]